MSGPSIIDRLRQDGRIAEALAWVLDREVDPKRTKAVRCINPGAHKNGDKHPSMVVQPEAGGVKCSCGLTLGILQIAVYRMLAMTESEAAKSLEERFYPTAQSAPVATPSAVHTAGGSSWPWYPKTAAQIGWEVFDDNGCPAMRCPTYLPDGSQGRVKIRRAKMPGRDTASFEPSDAPIGILNLPALSEASCGTECPQVAILAGETDLLAWTYHAGVEGIDVPGVSMATGEGARIHGDLAKPFWKCRCIVFYDRDAAGLKEGPKRVAELLEAGASSAVFVTVPEPHKDVCDYLRAGGTVRGLLSAAVQEATKAAAAIDQWDMADLINAPVPPEPEMLIERLVVRPSVNIFFGPPQSGKSAGMMASMIDLSMGGGPFLGAEEIQVKARPGGDIVLWVFGSEDIISDLHWRVQTAVASSPHGKDRATHGRFILATPGTMNLNEPDGLKWLQDKIAATKASVVFLDTVQSLTGGGFDTRDEGDVVPFLKTMHAIRDKDVVVNLVHHTNKASTDSKKGAQSKADSMLGSQAWRALSNTCLMFDAQDGNVRDVMIRPVKTKGTRKAFGKFRVTMQDDGRFVMLDDDDTAPEPDRPSRGGRPPKVSATNVLTLRSKHPTGVRWADIPELLAIGESTWRARKEDLVAELLSLGHVVVEGVLRWSK